MTITHLGSASVDFVNDILSISSTGANVALPAGGTAPVGAFTGGGDITLVNTTATPGTVTTRTAQQMYADITTALGYAPALPFQYLLRITHSAAATLTLAAGTGVTFGTGTYTVVTNSFRDFVITVTSAGAMTWQTSGTGTWS
jgi:hypothetical protein